MTGVWRFLRSTGVTFAKYLLIVIGGTVAFMVLAEVVGYLPYSDRPGPGWYGWFDGASLEEVWASLSYFTGWAAFAAWAAIFYVLPAIAVIRLLDCVGAPRLGISLLGGSAMSITTLWVVSGAGWYIAIGFAPVAFATVLGAVFGVGRLPEKTEAPETAR